MTRCWLNGRIRETRAVLAADDRGFTLGDGLFETMRAYGGHVFRLEQHLERMARGAQRLGMAVPDALPAGVAEALEANGLARRDAVVRITLSRGPGSPGLEPPARLHATALVTAAPYEPEERWYRDGASAAIAPGRVNEHGAAAGLKTTSRVEHVLARMEARRRGADQALLLDTDGHLAEADAANLFLVRDGALHTPPLSCGPLPGITRATVLELAARERIPVRQAPLPLQALDAAEEAFVTSSLRELVPLVRVEGVLAGPLSPGSGPARPGALTLRLLELYRALVRAE